MDYTHLGRSGLVVSRLCLGTMNFGPQTSEDDSFTIMDASIDAGINFIDTADVYGRPIGVGVTETIVGNWLAQGGGRRDKVVLATKVYGGMSDWPNDSHLSARHIIRGCEGSLRRLQTDYIDLYQMHHIDRVTPWEEIWQAMEQLVHAGKILYVGSSNFAGWHIAQAQEAAKARFFMGLVSEQSKYNLLERMVELEVLPACQDYGLGMIPWTPLASGLLGGITGTEDAGIRTRNRYAETTAEQRKAIAAFEGLCREIGQAPAHVALAWLLEQPAVAAPIIGPRTLEQFRDTLGALDVELAPEIIQQLDVIFPGPGGPAPEAYAW